MMQYDSFNEICSQGTQTKLSTSSKDDVLVSFTSTCSLLSSTFSQFLLEVSRLLQIPIDKQNPLISVDKLLSEFKERSLELHNIDTTELSFHSPLIPTSPQSSVSPPRSNQGSYLSASLDKSNSDSIPGTPPASPRDKTPSSTPTPPSSLSIPCSVPSLFPQPMMTNSLPADTPRVATRVSPLRLPVVPVPAKITKEQADSTNRITPPLPLNEMCIGNSSRSAFCKPAPKLVSPTSSVSSHTMTSQIKLEPSTPPANTKNETELLECLQKLQNCYEKYLTPPTLPFSLNSILHDIKPRQLPDIKPPVFKHLKPSCFEGLKPPTLESLKLPLPSTFQFLDRAADPNAIIKAMQERNPLLNAGAVSAGVQPRQQPTNNRPQLSPLFSSPMKCPYCNLTFHKKSHLSNHLVQLHSLSYHCCRQCKISFPDRQSLEHHQRSHPKQQFQCTGCNLSFKTGSELKRHVKTHTQERAFMCDICGSRFNLKHNLKAHMRQHTGERPFRCKICNRGFTRSNNLKRHLYAHCSAETTPQVSMSRTGGGAADQVLSMIPNMVMFDGSRLHSIPVQNEVKVD
ncbi:sal-like protein 1 [Bolinopsis microptera]|uniref:sal-like protein 1 n=1 Tax=Bolinopsis microptera TaxID=2820187 RepID=UPI00307A7873